MILSFCFFLLLFALVGLASVLKSKGTKQDYYLATSNISPGLVGLSAVATNNSGYMFIGVIGYTYTTGLASIWLMLGWITGDFLASTLVHRHLRVATEHTGKASYAGVLSHWTGQRYIAQQRLMGAISLLFLLAYASAQLVAGSKALHVLFGWPLWAGGVTGAALVILYCFAGGIRASIWTDVAQSIVMILSMGLLLFMVVASLGGIEAAITEMNKVEGFLNWFPKDLVLPGISGAALFAISWLFAGLSVVGQPHIMIRFMALSDTGRMWQAKLWYYLWFLAFYCLAIGVGMLSRVYLGDAGSFDAELALPAMAQQLLPPVFVGLILAGIFAATMSTADSLVLSCSAAITHDLLPHQVEKVWLLKLTTVVVTLLALCLALSNHQSVFNMVIMSWSGLASAFVPLLIALSLGKNPTQRNSIIAMIAGFTTALLWRYAGWHEAVYEGLPGILVGIAILVLLGIFNKKPKGKQFSSPRTGSDQKIDLSR